MGIPMLKIRWSWDGLIFNMGIPILVRRHLYTETAPSIFWNNWDQYNGCWCPGSLCHQVISNRDIDFVRQRDSCLPWGGISTICVISVVRNDINANIFLFISYIQHNLHLESAASGHQPFITQSGATYISYLNSLKSFCEKFHNSISPHWLLYFLLEARADSRLVPSQWETSLQSNAVSHWLGANLETALEVSQIIQLAA